MAIGAAIQSARRFRTAPSHPSRGLQVNLATIHARARARNSPCTGCRIANGSTCASAPAPVHLAHVPAAWRKPGGLAGSPPS
eukprot:5690459-Heterocapsa_arctica.AAC.1